MKMISTSREMAASPQKVFEMVSNLAAWPSYLPHYRWIRVMENHSNHQVVRMACYRSGIPIDWVSRFRADATTRRLHFEHLRAFTRGMQVIWVLEPMADGTRTRVTITHDLEPVAQRLGSFIAETIIGNFFIHYVATRTLKHFALQFETPKPV